MLRIIANLGTAGDGGGVQAACSVCSPKRGGGGATPCEPL
ncbi:hypothetical protein HMPREF9098_2303 [Kingella denitrificans ATCC 33394]|uniref:Uncharacterized protein n=1 Tax=Kingella denitrificans ATCC 33394 TaxID=888741 RepID=F0F2G8_9NEIS|nr:hypothetical protein HMPREF9098_2303 [Kingella denitrificans ATCC 33394]